MNIFHTQKKLSRVVIFSFLVYCIYFIVLIIQEREVYDCLYLGIMLFMTGIIVAIFGYSIRNKDYSMIAGYSSTLEYNEDGLRQSLLAMQMFIVKGYVVCFFLILIFQFLPVPAYMSLLVMIIFIIDFIISILYFQVKYRSQVVVNKQDQEVSNRSMLSTIYFIGMVFITVMALAIVFSLHGYKNNTSPAIIGGGIVMLIMIVNVIWLFLEQKRIEKQIQSVAKSYILITVLNIFFLILMFLYPYLL